MVSVSGDGAAVIVLPAISQPLVTDSVTTSAPDSIGGRGLSSVMVQGVLVVQAAPPFVKNHLLRAAGGDGLIDGVAQVVIPIRIDIARTQPGML